MVFKNLESFSFFFANDVGKQIFTTTRSVRAIPTTKVEFKFTVHPHSYREKGTVYISCCLWQNKGLHRSGAGFPIRCFGQEK